MFYASKAASTIPDQLTQQGEVGPTSASVVPPPFTPLSRQQVSEILGVHVRTLDNWQKAGRMPKSASVEGRVYWHPAVFYSWLDRKLRTTDHEEASVAVAEKNRAAGTKKPSRTPERLSSASRAVSRNQSALARMASGG